MTEQERHLAEEKVPAEKGHRFRRRDMRAGR
jgi:hypothetical protein